MSRHKPQINSLKVAKDTINKIKKASEENSLDIISTKNAFIITSELDKFSQNPEYQIVNQNTLELLISYSLIDEDGNMNLFVKQAISVEMSGENFSPFAFDLPNFFDW